MMKSAMEYHPKFSMAIPASIVSDVPHLREKTAKVGTIARAAAIFRVDEIIIFPDRPDVDQSDEIKFVETILSYMETPQYLRRRLFDIRPELRYVGILPPLRTPHHPSPEATKKLKAGDFREAVVTSLTKDGSWVDVGLDREAFLRGVKLRLNERLTVKVTKVGKELEVALASKDEIKAYWGYCVTISKVPLGRLLRSRPWDLTIAASRHGSAFMEVKDALVERLRRARTKFIAFGAPDKGMYEIFAQEGLNLNEVVDFVVNTIPGQGTETVRTEEAIYATLAILNLFASS